MTLYMVWAIGTTAIYLFVFVRRARRFRRYQDWRSGREVTSAAGFLVASALIVASTLLFLAEDDSGIRGVLVAVALAAYSAAGFVMATEEAETPPPG